MYAQLLTGGVLYTGGRSRRRVRLRLSLRRSGQRRAPDPMRSRDRVCRDLSVSHSGPVLVTVNERALLLRVLPAAPVPMDAAHHEKLCSWLRHTGARL